MIFNRNLLRRFKNRGSAKMFARQMWHLFLGLVLWPSCKHRFESTLIGIAFSNNCLWCRSCESPVGRTTPAARNARAEFRYQLRVQSSVGFECLQGKTSSFPCAKASEPNRVTVSLACKAAPNSRTISLFKQLLYMTIFGVEFSTFDASIFDIVTHTDHRHCSLRRTVARERTARGCRCVTVEFDRFERSPWAIASSNALNKKQHSWKIGIINGFNFIMSLGLDIWLVASRGSSEDIPFFTHQAGGPKASDSFYTKGC